VTIFFFDEILSNTSGSRLWLCVAQEEHFLLSVVMEFVGGINKTLSRGGFFGAK